MKLSSALFLASASSMASVTTSIRSADVRASLLSKSRRLDQNAEEDVYSFLSNYAIKLIGCAKGEAWEDPDEGQMEYSTVVYRLCPADDCNDSTRGCKKGYGDFAVGINTYVQAWLEDKQENMQYDDNFKIEDYGECREYQFEQGENADDGDLVYYVGPTCGTEKVEILLGLFSDYTCQEVPSKTFEELSNGWTLPYSTSGLVSQSCESCAGYNEQGEYAVSDMCTELYENAGKCMTLMESTNSYGVDESGCSYIQSIMPAQKLGAGAIVGWTIFALLIVCVAAFVYTKSRNKKTKTLEGSGERRRRWHWRRTREPLV